MKNNLSETEKEITSGAILVSECDTQGVITYANFTFCNVSGYSIDELIGSNQNIIRHPDLPKQIFADLWRTIASGAVWSGIIKNRCADGHYYWVNATITPVTDDSGTVISYRSLLRKASLDAIEQAKELYQRINNGEKIVIDSLTDELNKKERMFRAVNSTFFLVTYFIGTTAVLLSLVLFHVNPIFLSAAIVVQSLLSFCFLLYKEHHTKNALKYVTSSINSFMGGNLSTRINYQCTDQFNAIFKLLNRSSDTVEVCFSEINCILDNINNGYYEDISNFNMHGDFNVVNTNINKTVAELKYIFQYINTHIKIYTDSASNINHPEEPIAAKNFQANGLYAELFNDLGSLLKIQEARYRHRNEVIERAQKGDFSKLNLYANHEIGAISDLSTHLNDLFRTIEQNLMDIANMAENINNGDLSPPIGNKYLGLFAESIDGIDKMRNTLKTMIEVMTESIDVIYSTTIKIRNGNMDFAQRTEVQAVNLNKNAIVMDTLLVQVQKTADSASLANQLVIEASAVAVQGGKSVNEVVNTMATIDQSSRKVANIIGVIDDIAFQTNILSLNAAVEAARAGEQGRGFAVVASEVRSLAQRSAAAAKEIKFLINDSVLNVNKGNEQVNEAGKTISEVVSYVNRLTSLISDISILAYEQNKSIGQVNNLINQIKDLSELNNDITSESIDSIAVLSKQSDHLSETISQFVKNKGLLDVLDSKYSANQKLTGVVEFF